MSAWGPEQWLAALTVVGFFVAALVRLERRITRVETRLEMMASHRARE